MSSKASARLICVMICHPTIVVRSYSAARMSSKAAARNSFVTPMIVVQSYSAARMRSKTSTDVILITSDDRLLKLICSAYEFQDVNGCHL